MSIIEIDFGTKKRVNADQAPDAPAKQPDIRCRVTKVFQADFKTKTLIAKYENSFFEDHNQELDFSNFLPVPAGSQFSSFSPLERMNHSEHVLEKLGTMTLFAIMGYINYGVLDAKKASQKLGLPFGKLQK